MKKYFENASSLERWFIILVGLLFFIVLNLLFVRPLFGDWAKYKGRREKALTTLAKFQDTIAASERLKPTVQKMEGQGMAVPSEDQTVNLMLSIQQQASSSGVSIMSNSRQPERTNQFFIERAQAVNTLSTEDQLVDFLFRLGENDSSVIRVRGLSLRPDPPRQKLSGNITLVANYQKKAPVRAATSAALTNAPVAKPPAAPTPDKSKPTTVDKTKPPVASPINSGVPKPSTPTKNPK